MRKALFIGLLLAILIGVFNYSGNTFIDKIGLFNIVIGLLFLGLTILIIIKLLNISDDVRYIKEVIKSNHSLKQNNDQVEGKPIDRKN